ncbi:ATP-binding protein [Acidocella sp.]|uniref:ATP-binding protein n=1 Tax=Acidocella sp. TaxID=50710 RepID=UPI002630B49E|nr:ATP-binding protein [Acidocella sp.]MDD2794269.1 ATP-binding protein [Acidocella sp.]
MKLRPGGFSADRVLRRFLPRTLLGRSLLIVLIPLVLLQAVALLLFYGNHLNELSRRLAGGVAGEVGFMIDEIDRAPDTRGLIIQETDRYFQFSTVFLRNQVLRRLPPPDAPGPVDDDLARGLAQNLHRPFNVAWNTTPGFIRINVQMADGVLSIDVSRKRLYIGTFYLFLVWVIGTAGLLFGISALFLRTQVRGITRLAVAAEAFGMGRDPGPIKPEGAVEVRRAAAAFNRMQERLRRFLAQRTTMLAGVSHDLRTPLTRLRLSLAMLPEADAGEMAEMTGDIEEMEQLIATYLSFARGEGSEQAVPTDVTGLLEDVAAAARRAGARIDCDAPEGLSATLRPEAMRRVLTNLIDNARRHAGQMWLGAAMSGRTLRIVVEDDGPGIPASQREAVFRPFETASAGGTGLGLTIARDIVGAHGGDIFLLDRPGGGLRVVIELPA